MTEQFLERNKKKSLLALLLLLLRRRKVLVLLLLAMLLSTAAFVSPFSWLGGVLSRGASWLGAGGTSRSRSLGELASAFRSARMAGAGGGGWGFLAGRGAGAGGAAGGGGPDSVGMVKGGKDALGTGADGNAGGLGRSIKGVLTPEEAGKDGQGDAVAIRDGDLAGEREGFVRSAFAGGFLNGLFGNSGGLNGAGGGAGVAGGMLSGGAFAGRDFLQGKGRAVTPDIKDRVGRDLVGVASVPKPTGKRVGSGRGVLSAARAAAIDAKATHGLAGATPLGNQTAYAQLAEGRGRAEISMPPNCNAPGCPGEFASVNTGAIYDGNGAAGANGLALTAPHVDGFQTPNIPDTGLAQRYEDDAAKMQRDAQTCRALDDRYGPQETQLNQKMQDISDQFKAMACGSGGCSSSKAKKCKRLGDELKATCNQYMGVRCTHTHACPLTADANCSNECVETGNGTGPAKSMTVAPNDAGNGNAAGMKTEPDAASRQERRDCASLDAQYNPRESAIMDSMIQYAGRYHSLRCADSALTLSASDCARPLNQLTKACRCLDAKGNFAASCNDYNNKRCAHLNACAQTAGQDCAGDCGQVPAAADLEQIRQGLYGAP